MVVSSRTRKASQVSQSSYQLFRCSRSSTSIRRQADHLPVQTLSCTSASRSHHDGIRANNKVSPVQTLEHGLGRLPGLVMKKRGQKRAQLGDRRRKVKTDLIKILRHPRFGKFPDQAGKGCRLPGQGQKIRINGSKRKGKSSDCQKSAAATAAGTPARRPGSRICRSPGYQPGHRGVPPAAAVCLPS